MTKKQASYTGLLLLSALAALAALSVYQYGRKGKPGDTHPIHDELVAPALPSADVLPHKHDPRTALFGYKPDANATRKFLASLRNPYLRQAGPDLFKAPEKQNAFLYRPLYKAHKDTFGTEWVVGRQGIGDCVSWGWKHGCEMQHAIMYCRGDSNGWLPIASESIYGGSRVEARGVSRGGRSDGSYGAAAAKWVSKNGLIFRKTYEFDRDGNLIDREKTPDAVAVRTDDLTEYSSRRAKDWGDYGNGGENDKGWLDRVAEKSPVKNVALVTTFEEAAAAIQSGYPVPVCSGVGFTSTRDEQGFCRSSGSWSHCMCFIGVRWDREGLLCLNSWGPDWVKGPKWPDDQPDGSFWVDRHTVERMLRQNDSFSVSGYEGFPFKPLDNAAWLGDNKADRDSDEPIYAQAL